MTSLLVSLSIDMNLGFWCEIHVWNTTEQFDCILEVVEKKKTGEGFQVLPRRWVVERTFARLGRSRRLSKDYERKPTSSTGHVYMASIRLMLRRICKERTLLQGAALEAA